MLKKSCSTCHYFVRTRNPERGERHTFEISHSIRVKAAQKELTWQREDESLSCFRGIWDEGVGFPESSKVEQIATLRRNGRCYYFPYQPGMLLPAAEKLQDARLTQTRELYKLRLAVYALVVSILALLAKLLVSAA